MFGDRLCGNVSAALAVLMDALEGVAFKEADQVVRHDVGRELKKEGEAPYFTVVIKRSKKVFDTF
jgi:hypothetical protein